MQSKNDIAMQDSVNVDRQCASALLDAWCRNDAVRMSELADRANIGMKTLFATNPAESERLELLSAIAVELHKACALSKRAAADPYVRLLIRMALPDRRGLYRTYPN